MGIRANQTDDGNKIDANTMSIDELRLCVVALCDTVETLAGCTVLPDVTRDILVNQVKHTRSRVLGNT